MITWLCVHFTPGIFCKAGIISALITLHVLQSEADCIDIWSGHMKPCVHPESLTIPEPDNLGVDTLNSYKKLGSIALLDFHVSLLLQNSRWSGLRGWRGDHVYIRVILISSGEVLSVLDFPKETVLECVHFEHTHGIQNHLWLDIGRLKGRT